MTFDEYADRFTKRYDDPMLVSPQSALDLSLYAVKCIQDYVIDYAIAPVTLFNDKTYVMRVMRFASFQNLKAWLGSQECKIYLYHLQYYPGFVSCHKFDEHDERVECDPIEVPSHWVIRFALETEEVKN